MRKFTVMAAIARLMSAGLLCSCSALSQSAALPVPAQRYPAARTAAIGVLFDTWHTGLILPVQELGPLRSVLPMHPHERYVSFGWGNRRFYMTARPTALDAIEALFSSPSTLLVVGAPTVAGLLPADATYRWLCADRHEILKLDTYLLAALRQRAGKPIELGAGPWPDSEFYASGERYDAFHTCNTWTAQALHEAGLPVRAGAVIFSDQLRDRLNGLRVCRWRAAVRGSGAQVRARVLATASPRTPA
jgi:uncharacterized protein (TIGR02117 family)